MTSENPKGNNGNELPKQTNPKPKNKITLAEKRAWLVQVKESLQRKYQQVLGQIELIDELTLKGVDPKSVEIDNTEGVMLHGDS